LRLSREGGREGGRGGRDLPPEHEHEAEPPHRDLGEGSVLRVPHMHELGHLPPQKSMSLKYEPASEPRLVTCRRRGGRQVD